MISFDNELAHFTKWKEEPKFHDTTGESFAQQQEDDALAPFVGGRADVQSLHALEKEDILKQFGGKRRRRARYEAVTTTSNGKASADDDRSSRELQELEEKWNCRSCTFRNNARLHGPGTALAVVCEMCGTVDVWRKRSRERSEVEHEDLRRKEQLKLDSLHDLMADMSSSDEEDNEVGMEEGQSSQRIAEPGPNSPSSHDIHVDEEKLLPKTGQLVEFERETPFRGSIFFPSDILSIVLILLGEPKDCISIMCTCRLWSFVVMMDAKLWKLLAHRVEGVVTAQSYSLRKKNGGWLSYGGGGGSSCEDRTGGPVNTSKGKLSNKQRENSHQEFGETDRDLRCVPYTQGAFVCSVCTLTQATERDTCEMCAGDVVFAPVEIDGERIVLSNQQPHLSTNPVGTVVDTMQVPHPPFAGNAAFTRVDSLDHFKKLVCDGEQRRHVNELNRLQRRAGRISNQQTNEPPQSSSSAIAQDDLFNVSPAEDGRPPQQIHRLAFGLSRTMSDQTNEEMISHQKFKEKCQAISAEMDAASRDLGAAHSASPKQHPHDSRGCSNGSVPSMCGTPHEKLFQTAESTGDFYFATKCFLCDRKLLQGWKDYNQAGWSWLQKTLRSILKDIYNTVVAAAASESNSRNDLQCDDDVHCDFECAPVPVNDMDEATKGQLQKVMWKLAQRNWVMLYECLEGELRLQAEALVRDAVRLNIRGRGDKAELMIAECLEFHQSESETVLDRNAFQSSLLFSATHPRRRHHGSASGRNAEDELVAESVESVQCVLSLWRIYSSWVEELLKHCDILHEKIQAERERSWRSGSTSSLFDVAMSAFRSQVLVPCWMWVRLGKAISCHYHLGLVRHESYYRHSGAGDGAYGHSGENNMAPQEVGNVHHRGEILEAFVKVGLDADVETDDCFSVMGSLLGAGNSMGNGFATDSKQRAPNQKLCENYTFGNEGRMDVASDVKKRKRKKRGANRFSWEVKTGYLNSGERLDEEECDIHFHGKASMAVDGSSQHRIQPNSDDWRLPRSQLRKMLTFLSTHPPDSSLKQTKEPNLVQSTAHLLCFDEATQLLLFSKLCKLYYVLCAVDVTDDRLCHYKTQSIVRKNLLLPLHNVFVFSLSLASSSTTALESRVSGGNVPVRKKMRQDGDI
jgi:hypothetical protein